MNDSGEISDPPAGPPAGPSAVDAAHQYVRSGWAVIALHWMRAPGVCSCGSACGASAGKHPIGRRWQHRVLTSGADVQAVWDELPDANVGIVTGPPSGYFVLDVDPRHDGFERLAELTDVRGPLPRTRTVRTGSGGLHYAFLLPAGARITNSRGRLPVGLDIRGDGGFVVAPPSVSGFGPYRLEVNDPLVLPPAWLVELIRVRDREGPSTTVVADPADAARLEALGPLERARVARYAGTVVREELARLAAAGYRGASGSRNEVSFAVACNLIEVANAWWSGVDLPFALSGYLGVTGPWAGVADPFPVAEARAVWLKACARVGDRARAFPEAPDTVLGAAYPPGSAGQVPAHEVPELARQVAAAGVLSLDGLGGSASSATSPASALTSGDMADGPAEPDPVAELLAEMVDSAGLDAIPDPEPLIRGYLDLDTVTWMIGASGEGKSFTAISLAAAVGTGRDWYGHPVRAPGPVVYLAAEGARGLKKRIRAWEKHHGAGMDRVSILPRPVQAMGPEWSVLVEACRRLGPRLVVIDTQARVTIGAKENDAGEMGVFIEQAERLRRATGATVLVVHHTTKAGTEGRGSGALRGAMNSEISVSMHGTTVTVASTKQKDMARATALTLECVVVELGVDTWGDPVDSLVLVPAAPGASDLFGDAEFSQAALQLAEIFSRVFHAGQGGTKGEVKKECLKAGMSERTFYRAWNDLMDRGCFAKVSGTSSWRWVPVDERDV